MKWVDPPTITRDGGEIMNGNTEAEKGAQDAGGSHGVTRNLASSEAFVVTVLNNSKPSIVLGETVRVAY